MECLVIAGPELTLGFALAGVEGRVVASRDEARDAWAAACGAGTRLVLVSAEVEGWLADELSVVSSEVPLVAVVPGRPGSGTPPASLGTWIRQAVGIPL
jgi:vacuolar-type H+-ATPase subunit F/Vma7